jgi:Na+-driven multidrug efflux pump
MIRQYMAIWYIGIIFLIIPMVGNHALRAAGEANIPSAIMIFGTVLNIILDPLLIYGWAGFPRMELAGAALATVIARSISLVVALLVLHYRERMLDWSLPSLECFLGSCRRVLYIAGPAAATNALTPISLGIVTRLVSQYGEDAVAGVGAATRVESFSLLVYFALVSSLMPFIGQNWGAGKMDRVVEARRLSNRFAILWGVMVCALFSVFAEAAAGIFSDKPAVIEAGAAYLWIASAGYGFMGVVKLTAAGFNAINKPLWGAGLNFVRMFALYVPLAALGSWFFESPEGVFAGIGVANIIAGLIALGVLDRLDAQDGTASSAKNTEVAEAKSSQKSGIRAVPEPIAAE